MSKGVKLGPFTKRTSFWSKNQKWGHKTANFERPIWHVEPPFGPLWALSHFSKEPQTTLWFFPSTSLLLLDLLLTTYIRSFFLSHFFRPLFWLFTTRSSHPVRVVEQRVGQRLLFVQKPVPYNSWFEFGPFLGEGCIFRIITFSNRYSNRLSISIVVQSGTEGNYEDAVADYPTITYY